MAEGREEGVAQGREEAAGEGDTSGSAEETTAGWRTREGGGELEGSATSGEAEGTAPAADPEPEETVTSGDSELEAAPLEDPEPEGTAPPADPEPEGTVTSGDSEMEAALLEDPEPEGTAPPADPEPEGTASPGVPEALVGRAPPMAERAPPAAERALSVAAWPARGGEPEPVRAASQAPVSAARPLSPSHLRSPAGSSISASSRLQPSAACAQGRAAGTSGLPARVAMRTVAVRIVVIMRALPGLDERSRPQDVRDGASPKEPNQILWTPSGLSTAAEGDPTVHSPHPTYRPHAAPARAPVEEARVTAQGKIGEPPASPGNRSPPLRDLPSVDSRPYASAENRA
ncbi:hypothetical protein J2S55_001836 [Streptosporangium brasiliense]|uniref:Skin secretory protein xP2-like n=1 Tax=Streptosporangium brasiliense TaxID=47480 RepID=A0ABT9R2C2_9ACTN|nr:hypothetical protein [Streptosporangium brasiliense]